MRLLLLSFVCFGVSVLLVYMHLFCIFACHLLLSLLQVLYVCFISLFIVAVVVAVCTQVQCHTVVFPF